MSLDQREALFLIGFLIVTTLIVLCIVSTCLCYYKRCKSPQVLEKASESKTNYEQSSQQNPYVLCDFSINQ